MINISSASNLGIIVPSKNKALAEVLTNASQSELETLSQGKGLKSILNTILKQSTDSTSTNKELLTLVKNNPTLKNLGNVTTTIQDLLGSLKSDKQQLPIEKTLKTYLTDIKDLKGLELKNKIENSGIFLESKLKNILNPQVELKNTLISLAKNLQNNPSVENRTISNEIKVLLNTEALKSALTTDVINNKTQSPKVLEKLSAGVESLISTIKSSLKNVDTIHNPNLSNALQKLEHLIEPKTLTPENFKLNSIIDSLKEISLQMSKSFTLESKGIIQALEKIFATLKNIEQTPIVSKTTLEQFLEKNIPQDIKQVSETIRAVLLKSDPIFSKDTMFLLNKLEVLNTPQTLHAQNHVKEILSNDLKAILLQASEEITKTVHPNQNDILKHIDKLALQIDNYQLLSHLSNGTSLFLPFAWDMLEDGNIEIKKDTDEKFYCDIHLKLKEYGPLNIKLTLFEKNQLNIHIYSSHENFKKLMQEAIPNLRSALIDEQITPREIRILDLQNTTNSSPYTKEEEHIHIGFEVKG